VLWAILAGGSMATPEAAAAAVLKKISWDGSLPIDPVRIARQLNIEVFNDKDLVGSSNSGRCVVTESGDRVIIVNPSDSVQRQRFTVAHELGHALFDEQGDYERSEKKYNLENYRKNEAKMNRFAASLIMPEDSVRSAYALGKDLKEMADLFGVSQIAMRIRLERLGILAYV